MLDHRILHTLRMGCSWQQKVIDQLERRGWMLALSIALVTMVLRWGGLTDYWLNPDEGIYYSIITWANSSEFWKEVAGNAHPPLYYLVLRLVAAFSEDFLWFRAVALVFGCTAIYGFYLLGKELDGPLTGIFAALFLAVSRSATVQSQLMRPYMMQLALLVFGLWSLIRYLRSQRSRLLIAYAAWMLLAIMTHYSSFLFVGGTMIVLAGLIATKRIEGERIRPLLMAHAPLLIGMAGLYFFHLRPTLINSALQVDAQERWLRPYMIHSPADAWTNFMGLQLYFFGDYKGTALVLFVAGLVLAWLRRKPWLHALPVVLLCLAGLGAATKQYPVGCSRHSMYLCMALFLPIASVLGSGIGTGGRKALATLAGVALLVLLRAPLAALDSSSHWPAAAEQMLSRENLVRMTPHLRELPQRPRVIIMSMQTYYVLLPYYHAERSSAKWAVDRDYFHFKWDRAQVLVNRAAWDMTMDPAKVAGGGHFPTFLDMVDREVPELSLAEQDRVVMIFAGWVSPLESHMQQLDMRLQASDRLIRSRAAVLGLDILEYDVKSFMKHMRKSMQPQRQKR